MFPGKRNTIHNKVIHRASSVCLPLNKARGDGVMKDAQSSVGQQCSGEQTQVGLEQYDERIHRSSQDLKSSQNITKLQDQDVKSVLLSVAISPAHRLEPDT